MKKKSVYFLCLFVLVLAVLLLSACGRIEKIVNDFGRKSGTTAGDEKATQPSAGTPAGSDAAPGETSAPGKPTPSGDSSDSTLEVPYRRVELFVNDIIQRHFSTAPSHSFEILSHRPDVESHTDEISIAISADYDYGGYTMNAVIVFEYNRASDLWTATKEPYAISLNDKKMYWNRDDFIGTWVGRYRANAGEETYGFELRIDQVDFDSRILTGSYIVEDTDFVWNDRYQMEWYDFEHKDSGMFSLEPLSDADHSPWRVETDVDVLFHDQTFYLSPEHGVQFKQTVTPEKYCDGTKQSS